MGMRNALSRFNNCKAAEDDFRNWVGVSTHLYSIKQQTNIMAKEHSVGYKLANAKVNLRCRYPNTPNFVLSSLSCGEGPRETIYEATLGIKISFNRILYLLIMI